jgi:hypothetical protein
MKKLPKYLFSILICSLIFVAVACTKGGHEDNRPLAQDATQTIVNDQLEVFENVAREILPKVTAYKNSRNLLKSKAWDPSMEAEIMQMMIPLMEQSKNLLEAYEIDYHEYFIPDDSRIILAGLAVFRMNQLIKENNSVSGTLYSEKALKSRSETVAEGSWWDCLTDALGLGAVTTIGEWVVGSQVLTRSAVLAILGKVAAKYAPGIGIAVAIADFTECMGWW